MKTEVSPTGDLLDRLIDAMPRMAEAVNSFELKDNQRFALQALLSAAGVHPTVLEPAREVNADRPLSIVPPLPAERSEVKVTADATGDEQTSSRTKRARKSNSKKSWPRAKDINFRPADKQSLRDFVAEKKPATIHEKNLVFVYYMAEVLGLSQVTIGHVLAAYDECGDKPPALPDSSLRSTAARKHWLDTAELQTVGVQMTHSGRNVVEHDMPMKKDKKSA